MPAATLLRLRRTETASSLSRGIEGDRAAGVQVTTTTSISPAETLPPGARKLTETGLQKVRSAIETASSLDELEKLDDALATGDTALRQRDLGLNQEDTDDKGFNDEYNSFEDFTVREEAVVPAVVEVPPSSLAVASDPWAKRGSGASFGVHQEDIDSEPDVSVVLAKRLKPSPAAALFGTSGILSLLPFALGHLDVAKLAVWGLIKNMMFVHLTGVLNARRHGGATGSRRVFLTSLCGGVFGNRDQWVRRALDRFFKDLDLDVRLENWPRGFGRQCRTTSANERPLSDQHQQPRCPRPAVASVSTPALSLAPAPVTPPGCSACDCSCNYSCDCAWRSLCINGVWACRVLSRGP